MFLILNRWMGFAWLLLFFLNTKLCRAATNPLYSFQREKDKIVLYTDNESTMKGIMDSLKQWKLRREGVFEEKTPPWSCPDMSFLNGFHCMSLVDPVLTKFVRERVGTYADHEGPNCLNASLNALGILDRLEYTQSDDFQIALDKRCQMRDESEPPQAGDLIALKGGTPMGGDSNTISHSFIFLSEILSFGKRSKLANSPYQFSLVSSDLEDHFVFTGCQTPWKGKPDKPCYPPYVKVYRCD